MMGNGMYAMGAEQEIYQVAMHDKIASMEMYFNKIKSTNVLIILHSSVSFWDVISKSNTI